MAQEQFKIDGVTIKAPDTYKPVFATTSTESSKRSQDLVMHNTPMGTIAGYDMEWGELKWGEIATILNSMINKSQFTFHHKDPRTPANGLTRRSMHLISTWQRKHSRIMRNDGQD